MKMCRGAAVVQRCRGAEEMQCRGEEVVQTRMCRGGSDEVVQRCWYSGGAEVV